MFEALTASLVTLALNIIQLFPASPIQPLIATLSTPAVLEVLSFVNWFVPVGTMLGVLSGWLACVAAYYVYQILLRWIKVVE